MFWPFAKKSNGSDLEGAQWVAKVTAFTQKIAKAKSPMARDLVRTLATGNNLGEHVPHKIELELVVLSMYLAQRDLQRRYGGGTPIMLKNMLLDRVAMAMGDGQADDLAVDGLRNELKTMYASRETIYKNCPRVRAASGDSEHGTLVDVFGKMITGTYAQRNAMARVIVTTSAMELVKTVPAFLDEVGFAR